MAKALDDAADDTGKNASKSNEDIKDEIGRAGKDPEQVVSAIGTLHGADGTKLSTLEQTAIRVRVAKVIDAIWHLDLAPYQANSKSAALAATESSARLLVAESAHPAALKKRWEWALRAPLTLKR